MSTTTVERVVVTTVAEMDALSEGTRVTISGTEPGWTKRNSVWCLGADQHGIAPVNFQAYLGRNEVVVMPPVNESVEVGPGVTITPITTPEATGDTTMTNVYRQELVGFRTSVQDALHEYLGDHEGLTSTEREDLQEVLENLGLDRHESLVEVEVEVTVTGTYAAYMDSAMAEEVGGDVTVDMQVRTNIEWSKTFTYEANEHPEGQCACENVTNDWVGDVLNGDDISFDDFDFETSCPNC